MILGHLINSICNLITGQLKFPKIYQDKIICMDDGVEFKIFRHMHFKSKYPAENGAIFVVRFKFKKFNHKTNMKLSRIPILLIAGFPGFRDKVWMIDWKTNFWQGIYQWKDVETIEKYKKSFVLSVMNKRSVNDSIEYHIIPNNNIDDYLKSKM